VREAIGRFVPELVGARGYHHDRAPKVIRKGLKTESIIE
jgi:hypothetical protein